MSMKTIMRGLVAACAAALGLNAWAADIEVTNVGKIVHPTGGTVNTSAGNYEISDLRITADESIGLAYGDIVKVKKVAIAYATSGTNTASHHLQLNGVDSAEMTTDTTMAIGNENVATYVFENDVYAVVGVAIPMYAKNAAGEKVSNFRIRVYDHQSVEQALSLRAIGTVNAYAKSNWGAMYRAVIEKVPSYTVGSLNAYLTTSNQTLIPGATLADLIKGTIIGKTNGGSISDRFKEYGLPAIRVTEVKEEDTLTKVTMQFHLIDDGYIKAVLAEATQTEAGVVIKSPSGAKYISGETHYGEDASTGWNNNTLAPSASQQAYGLHDIRVVAPYKPVYLVETSKTYAELNVVAPAAGEKAAVVVSADAVLTFANETIPTGVDFIAEDAAAGIKVAGTIPAALYANTKMTIVGSATMPTDLSVSGTTIALAGGTLSGSDSARFHVVGDMTIPVSGESAISNLWMGNSNTRRTLTLDVAADATMTLGKIVNSYKHTILKDGDGVLKVTSNISNKEVDYQLKAGSIVAKAGETSVEPHSSVSGLVIVASEPDTEGYTTYTLGLAPRTDPTTIYAVDFGCSGFKLEDGTATTMIDGDVVVFPADCGEAGQWKGDGSKLVEGHEVVVNKEMNWKSSVSTMTIGTDATVYYYEGTINEGASISGAGTLKIFNSKTLTGDVTITTAIVFADGEVYADPTVTLTLSDGATLTVSTELASGKVLSGDATKKVVYSEGVYSLVDKTATELFVEAIAAAADGATVTLTDAITLEARIDVEAGDKTITIDLGGYTITPTATCGNGSAFDVKSGTVTIKNGTIDGSAITQTADDRYDNECDAITVRSGANVTLEGLTVKVNSITGSCAYPFNGATLTVLSGTYTNASTTEGPARELGMCFNQADVATQAVFVKGGSMSKDPALGDNSGNCTSFLAEGYVSTLTEGLYVVTEKPTPTRPSVIEGGSTDQKAAYDKWAKEAGDLSGLDNAQIIDRFIFNVGAETPDEDLEDALDDVIEKTDCFAKLMAEIAKGTDPTAYTFTLEVYPNATFKFVEVPETEIKTSAKLFRLTATFVPAN